MDAFFDGKMQGRCRLHIPKSYRNIVFGNEKEFYVTHCFAKGIDCLVMYRKALFSRLHDLVFPKEWTDETEHDRIRIYPSTELGNIEDNGRILLSAQSLAELYGLRDRKSIDSIVKPVKVELHNECLFVVKPEDFDKYRALVQSTVNNSESCSTSSIPNRAPASSHP